MLKLNIADYLIYNLSGKGEDENPEIIAKNIDFLVNTWSQKQYLAAQQISNDDFLPDPQEILFENYSLRAIGR